MKNDIIAQLDRAKELLIELEKQYNEDIRNQVISTTIRIRTQEILQILRNILDQTMQSFFSKHIISRLASKQQSNVRIYFPIRSSLKGLENQLEFSCNYKTFKTDFPVVYSYLASIQPYNSGYEWFRTLQEKSNEKHLSLLPQEINGETATILAKGKIKIRGRGAINFINTKIGDVLLEKETVNIDTTLNSINSRLEPTRIWASIVFENTKIDVFQFCNNVISKVEKVIDNFFNRFI